MMKNIFTHKIEGKMLIKHTSHWKDQSLNFLHYLLFNYFSPEQIIHLRSFLPKRQRQSVIRCSSEASAMLGCWLAFLVDFCQSACRFNAKDSKGPGWRLSAAAPSSSSYLRLNVSAQLASIVQLIMAQQCLLRKQVKYSTIGCNSSQSYCHFTERQLSGGGW